MQLFKQVLLFPVRLTAILLCVLLGFLTQVLFFFWVRAEAKRYIIAIWSRLMLTAFGIKLTGFTQYSKQTEVALYVSNHVSWLDILVIQAVFPVVFVAKQEIKSWPILGWLVSMAGTCFINRSRRSALLKVHSTLTTHLKQKQSICIFPEGTTSNGQTVLPFHASLFQAAIDAQVGVQPIYVHYSHSAAAYVDNISLLTSVGLVLLSPNLQVTIQVAPQLPTHLMTRQQLAIEAHQKIVSEFSKVNPA